MPVTYDALATTVLANNTTNSVTFSSISQSYTDLLLVLNGSVASNASNHVLRFNGDTSSNYSTWAYFWTPGSSTLTRTNFSSIEIDYACTLRTTSTSTVRVHINNYRGSGYRGCVSEAGQPDSGAAAICAGFWNSTAAISSMTILSGNGSAYASGSRFTLYGILRA